MPESKVRQVSVPKEEVLDHQHIRQATLEDLDALVDLEETCFARPWSRKSFEAELEGNQFSRVFMLIHHHSGQESQFVGYICVWIVFEEIRFLNLAIRQGFRRQGFGKQLIRAVLDLAVEASCCRGMLEVRETNVVAKNLYEHFNFKPYATRKSYYTNPTEDAILMILEPLGPTIEERNDEQGTALGSQTTIHTNS